MANEISTYKHIGCIVGMGPSTNLNIFTLFYLYRSAIYLKVMYSIDLRSRVIWLKFGLGYRPRDIAMVLQISQRSIYRIIRKFTNTGLLNCERTGRPCQPSLHIYEQFVLMEAVLKNRSLTLKELLLQINRSTGSEFNCSTVCRILRKFGITRKKVVYHVYWLYSCYLLPQLLVKCSDAF